MLKMVKLIKFIFAIPAIFIRNLTTARTEILYTLNALTLYNFVVLTYSLLSNAFDVLILTLYLIFQISLN